MSVSRLSTIELCRFGQAPQNAVSFDQQKCHGYCSVGVPAADGPTVIQPRQSLVIDWLGLNWYYVWQGGL